MFALTIIFSILLVGFAVLTTIDYVKKEKKEEIEAKEQHYPRRYAPTAVQVAIPILTAVTAVLTMIFGFFGMIEIGGSGVIWIAIFLIAASIAYNIIEDEVGIAYCLPMLSMYCNIMTIISVLFVVSNWN